MPDGSGDNLCVVVDATGSSDLRTRMESWGRAGLLRPFLYADLPDDEHEEWTATLVRPGVTSSGHAPLEEQVAASGVRTLRLVLVRACQDQAPILDDAQRGAVENLELRLRAGRPAEGAVGAINLVVPIRGATLEQRLLDLNGHWAHVVVAPEDRVAIDQFAVGVSSARFTAHAAVALASVTGLWSQVPEAPSFIERQRGAGAGRSRIVLCRSMVKIADAGRFVHQAARLVAVPGVDGWEIPIGMAPEPECAEDPDEVVAHVAEQICGQSGSPFVFRPGPPDPQAPRTVIVGPFEAVRRAVRYLVDRGQQVPGDMRDKAVAAAIEQFEEAIQAATFGEDSQFEVRLFGDDRPRRHKSTDLLDPSIADQAQRILKALDEPVVMPSQPEAWSYLLQCSFALLDAGPLPTDVELPDGPEARVVIQQPDLISPHPEPFQLVVPLTPNGDVKISPFDRFGAERALHLLSTAGTQSVPPPAPDSASGINSLAAGAEATEAAGGGADEELSADGSTDVLGALQQWVDVRRRSLLWQVMGGLQDDRRQASAALQQALQKVRELMEQSDRELRSDPLGGWGWLFLTAAVIGPIGAVVALVAGLVAPLSAVMLAAGAIIAGGTGAISVVAVHEWRRFQAVNRRDERDWQIQCLAARVRHAAREVRRLELVEGLLCKWAEAISYICHWPFGHPDIDSAPDDDGEPVSEVVADGEPLALEVGDACVSDDGQVRLANSARTHVLHVGWLSTRFAELEDVCRNRLAYRTSKSIDAVPRLIEDSRPSERTPLGFFLHLLKNEPQFTRDHDRLVQAVTRACLDERLDRLVSDVKPARRGSLGSTGPVPLAPFLTSLFPEADQEDREKRRISRELWEREVPETEHTWGRVSLREAMLDGVAGDVDSHAPVLDADDRARFMAVRVDSCSGEAYSTGGGKFRLATPEIALTAQTRLQILGDPSDKRTA